MDLGQELDIVDWRAMLLESAQDILNYSSGIIDMLKSNQMSWFGEKKWHEFKSHFILYQLIQMRYGSKKVKFLD